MSEFCFRFSALEFFLFLSLLACPVPGVAQPKNPVPGPKLLSPAEGEKQARALIANLLDQKPTENSTNTGLVQIRDRNGKRSQLPAIFEILVSPTNYETIYGVTASAGGAGTFLTIVHSGSEPNQYRLSESDPAAPPKTLTPEQLMVPFAGSDFWIADLGLDFLHWPQQRISRKEMRRNVFCAVLESVNPHPVPGGYSKVVSWIGTSHPDEIVLVHADAFDSHGDRLKQFDPKNLEKINGAYQLESMEMRNSQTGSHTIIDFNLKAGH